METTVDASSSQPIPRTRPAGGQARPSASRTVGMPTATKYAIPFQRPSELARSAGAGRESSAYCVNASAIAHGSNAGSSPRTAQAAQPAVTKSASTVWSARPPSALASP